MTGGGNCWSRSLSSSGYKCETERFYEEKPLAQKMAARIAELTLLICIEACLQQLWCQRLRVRESRELENVAHDFGVPNRFSNVIV